MGPSLLLPDDETPKDESSATKGEAEGSNGNNNNVIGTSIDSGAYTQKDIASCYLPGTNVQYAWDSTSLGLFKTCPRLYQYTMIDGWTQANDNIHLRFGIEYHQALQEYDLSRAEGIPHDDAVHDTLRNLLTRIYDWTPEPNFEKASEKNKSKHNLIRSILWYLDKFKDDPAKTYIMANGKPAVELSFRFELDWGPKTNEQHAVGDYGGPYLLSGHLDRVVSFNDALFVMDRKTTTTTPGDYFFDRFHPDNQMSLYTFASQVVLQAPVKGVIIDAAQVAIGFSRFVRGMTYRTKEQIEEWVKDLHYWFAKAEDYATEGYWPMNDTACDKYGGCRFREICQKSPQVRDQFLKANFVKQALEDRWNPLKPR